jgi:SHS2 domain-containing protein
LNNHYGVRLGNWLEELAENWFRMRGYITQLNVRIPSFGRRELDLLAFNDDEFWIVDLQTFVGEKGSIKEEVESLKQRFDVYEKGLRNTAPYKDLIKNRSLKRMFIAEGISDEFLKEVQKGSMNIECTDMEDFLRNILQEVKKYSDSRKWPFSEADLSRLLYELLSYGFVNL